MKQYFLFALLAATLAFPIAAQAQDIPENERLTIGEARPNLEGWTATHERFLRRVKKGDIDLVFFGDSITEWWPREDFIGRYGKSAANFGIGGDQVQHILWRVQNGELDGIAPKVAVVMVGTNNLTANSSTEQIVLGIKKLTEAIREKSPTTKVLLLGVFPRGWDGKAWGSKIADINQQIAKFDDGKDVRFLNIGAQITNAQGGYDKDMSPDGTHLLPASYPKWADAIAPLLTEMMGGPIVVEAPKAADVAAPKAAPVFDPATRLVVRDLAQTKAVQNSGNSKVELVEDAARGQVLNAQFGMVNPKDWFGGFWLPIKRLPEENLGKLVGIAFSIKGDGTVPRDTFVTLTTEDGVPYRSKNIPTIFEDDAWHEVVLKPEDFALTKEWIKANPEAAATQAATPPWTKINRFDFGVVGPLMNQKTTGVFGNVYYEFEIFSSNA